MFSKFESKLINGYAKYSSRLCVIRADWDEESKQLKKSDSKFDILKMVINYMIIGTTVFFLVWSILRIERVFLSMAYDFNDLFKICYVLICSEYLMIVVFRLAFTYSNDNLLGLFNQMQTYVSRNEMGEKKNVEEDHKKRSRRLNVFHKVCWLAGFWNALGISVIEAHYMWNITNSTGLSIFIATMLQVSLFTATILIWLVQLFMFQYFGIISSTISSSNLNLHHQAEGDQMMRKYCGLTILATNFNQTYCKVIVPAIKYVVSLIAMMCVLIAVRLAKSDAPGSTVQSIGCLILASYCFALVAVGVDLMSQVWQKSVACLSNFYVSIASFEASSPGAEQVKKYFNYKVRSLRQIKFDIAGMYSLEKEAKLTFIDKLVSGTANLLIGFQE